MQRRYLAIDIGGANLKAADGLGYARWTFFPLWQRPQELIAALAEIIESAPSAESIVATMTGELADCYATKAEGVTEIVRALIAAADGRQVWIYSTTGCFLDPDAALADPVQVAASNWHALARLASRHVTQGRGLLVDVGSTTTDLVPLAPEGPIVTARTDPERLLRRELIYTGVVRSPICALVDSLPWRKRMCPVAHEVFATTCDVYVMLGELPEDPRARNTADGRGLTRELARDRLARSICADRDVFEMSDAHASARLVAESQLSRLYIAASHVVSRLDQPPQTFVLSGEGEFLARRIVERLDGSANTLSLSETLGPHVSRVAPCHALAVLAAESNLT